jgi:hypothetical protein
MGYLFPINPIICLILTLFINKTKIKNPPLTVNNIQKVKIHQIRQNRLTIPKV